MVFKIRSFRIFDQIEYTTPTKSFSDPHSLSCTFSYRSNLLLGLTYPHYALNKSRHTLRAYDERLL